MWAPASAACTTWGGGGGEERLVGGENEGHVDLDALFREEGCGLQAVGVDRDLDDDVGVPGRDEGRPPDQAGDVARRTFGGDGAAHGLAYLDEALAVGDTSLFGHERDRKSTRLNSRH